MAEPAKQMVIEYDGGLLADILSWRVLGNVQTDTLQWRFIGPSNRTLVVRPIQIPSNERPLCVPKRISPALPTLGWLILLAHQRASVVGGPDRWPDNRAIHVQADKAVGNVARSKLANSRKRLLQQANKERPSIWRPRFERYIRNLFEELHQGRLARTTAKRRDVFRKFRAEHGMEADFRRFIYGQLVERHQSEHADIWEKAKKEGEAISEKAGKLREAASTQLSSRRERFYREVSLYELNELIRRHTGKPVVLIPSPGTRGYTSLERKAVVKALEGSKTLQEIREFIIEKCEVAGAIGNNMVHQAERLRLLNFICRKIGEDVRVSVLKDFHKDMPGWLETWSQELAQTRGMDEQQALNFLSHGIQFVAECEGRVFGHNYPVQDIAWGTDLQDKADAAPYEIQILHGHRREPAEPASRGVVVATTRSSDEPGRAPAVHPLAESGHAGFEFVNLDGAEFRRAGPHMVRRSVLCQIMGYNSKSKDFRTLLECHRERWFYRPAAAEKVKRALAAKNNPRVAAFFDSSSTV